MKDIINSGTFSNFSFDISRNNQVRIDWSKIPEEYIYATLDSDLTLKVHKVKPTYNQIYRYWDCPKISDSKVIMSGYPHINFDNFHQTMSCRYNYGTC